MNSPLIYLIKPCLIAGRWYGAPFEFLEVGHERALELDRRQIGLAVAKVPHYANQFHTNPDLDDRTVAVLERFLEGVLDFPDSWQDDDWRQLIAHIHVEPDEPPPPPPKKSKKAKNAAAQ